MGVPALFRWLSKKYPKIVLPVVEEEEPEVAGENGIDVSIPIDISKPNPNGVEFDNLYLDMNGIVHPCTHPEGKPAPETEEEMMLEIFQYTERVVNMVRPRRLLVMAIDGVAPRAKMNQQRSRRFRSAQEAKDKEEARKESIAIWESMGKTISDEEKNKVAWDSNAITPGTPFMDLLATSLRYWVVHKLNNDPGWKSLEVLISDASIPGEGEHKIMDFIRRQRTNPGYDPNTKHVIYGLDADLIMLSLATHEPHFRVLREDVFANDKSPTACRICGQEGHFAAQCTGMKKEKQDEHDVQKKPITKKPFIFLDVPILREYLEIELNIPSAPFAFDLERAIDDWVLLIFFVGNDFLPHLPSLEIREGAIDTLLKIWKDELGRMGGYLTNHGKLEYARAEIILEGLTRREDDIFRRRRETEERQDQNAKRRKLEASGAKGNGTTPVAPSPALQITSAPTPPVPGTHGLPARPSFDSFESEANLLGFGSTTATPLQPQPLSSSVSKAVGGSNRDWVANRRAIRLANMSAAEMLKAEMASLQPVKADSRNSASLSRVTIPSSNASILNPTSPSPTTSSVSTLAPVVASVTSAKNFDPAANDFDLPPGLSFDNPPEIVLGATPDPFTPATSEPLPETSEQPSANAAQTTEDISPEDESENPEENTSGVKRKLDETNDNDDTFGVDEDDEDDGAGDASVSRKLKVNADGSVDQEDTVRLWEPGYRERYYRQKFGVELSDIEFRRGVAQCYVEGLSWVLHYYYQGAPSWNWYYPYHFAPFAADFIEVSKMDIKFEPGQPFKPFEQLMAVFPPASRKHIPEPFHRLMIEEDSPILDFYPESFEIDMNGKKMLWQGVALLPFIDEKRLLDALATRYPLLSEDEVRRNAFGTDVIMISEEHTLYPTLETLYTKRKITDPVVINPKYNSGINGSLLPDPQCIPGSTYDSPLISQGLPDISGNRSISALYIFPKQLKPHRSMLLPGVRKPPRTLTSTDYDMVKRGGRGRGNFRDNRQTHYAGEYRPEARISDRRPPPPQSRSRGDWGRPPASYNQGPPPRPSYGPPPGNSYGGSYGGRGGRGRGGAPYSSGPPSSYGGNGGSGQSGYGGYGGSGSEGYGGYGGSASYGGSGGHGSSGYGGYGDSDPYGSSNGYGGSSYGHGPNTGYSGSGGYNSSNQGGYGGYGGSGGYSGQNDGYGRSAAPRGRGYGRY